ncbi:MAG: SDR family NAD(P)-dependent oxidoreductase [Candidatus Planktophila sp.]|nr:SDR family NAD(P)-dependent oxidoreductase [Candidatus Planktophila sp.]
MSSDSNLSIGSGLEGKRIIVTGASSGIGKAIALLLERVGASVIAIGLDQGRLSQLAGEFSDPSRHLTLSVDLSTESCAEEIMEPTITRFGGVDAVILAGATLRRKDLKDVSVTDWDYQLDTNLRSTFLIGRAVAEHLKENKRTGSILTFTSPSWSTGSFFGADAYSASKAGIVAFSRGLAKQLGIFGIRVNTISPGQIDTPMQHRDNDPKNVQAIIDACPLRRLGQPEEIASVAVFVTSDHGSFITGATLNISGGVHIY